MASTKPKVDMFNSEQGTAVRLELQAMQRSVLYTTTTSYSANSAYPDHQMPFVTKHLTYLNNHQHVNPDSYLSNLRLMLKIRK